ncbi:hypothetical protein EV197_3163 [Aquimarina brevivitae]|uniref:Uncharacterized protein n=2 Tax=Aquimarina brevivitae TaxID=323412 RepID=A0A4Q7NUA7_9FLAO|nr:hypothetical protein EV197_3163 [Aquimarina brevivitae]
MLVVIPVGVLAQNFELEQPNITKLKAQQEQSNYQQDVLYTYLLNNYKVSSDKTDVKMYDYSENMICAFTQEFENGITYTEAQCKEAGGKTITLTLPRTNKESLIQWIEAMFQSTGMDIKHSWNSEKTIYRPADEGAGCYYEIKETDMNTLVKIYCGC